MKDYFKKQICSQEGNKIFDISLEEIFQFIHINEFDRLECKKITENVYNNVSDINPNDKGSLLRFELYNQALYINPKTDGFIMNYPHGKIITQSERNHFYRGENQIYSKSVSSLLRHLNKIESEEDKEIYKIIANMRVAEFGILLCKFNYIQQWPYKTGAGICFDAIAQHYGLETNWLDITNDFMVALFFATCFFDSITKKWKPLTKKETEKSESTQYGIIFHCPSWQKELHNSYVVNNVKGKPLLDNRILPIGFQPFMRCHMQYGYGINMVKEYPLQNDVIFEKLRFRHDEKLSNWVFERMLKGNLIYPHEGLSRFNDIIDKIKNSSVFSEEAYNCAFSKNTFFNNDENCLKKVQLSKVLNTQIKIKKNVTQYSPSRQRKKSFDKSYNNFSIEKEYNIKLITRKVL